MPTRKPKDTEPDIQLLTTAKCPSISGRSQITYSIGVLDDEIFIKIVCSSGGGEVNNAPIAFAEIHKLLENYSDGGSFSSAILSPIFTHLSANMAPFTLAVAHKEQLVKPQEGKRTKFVYNNPTAFLAKVDKLIAAKATKKAPRRKTKATT